MHETDFFNESQLNIEETLSQRKFTNIADPEDAIATFSECIESQATHSHQPVPEHEREKIPSPPFVEQIIPNWQLVKKARKAFREWRKSPLYLPKRMGGGKHVDG
jgi:hypothetical protein